MAKDKNSRSRVLSPAKIFAGTTLAALALAACSPTDNSNPSSSGDTGNTAPVELRVLANITPVMTKEYYEALVQPWVDKQDNVKVIIEIPTSENVQTSLQERLASKDVPDVVASQLDTVVVPQLLPFPDAQWVKDTPLWDQNTADGVVWQVSTGAQAQSLVFYNKEAFTAAGINELPKSLDEMTAAMEQLKAAGYMPLQTAGEWVTGAQFQWFATGAQLADGNFWADKTAGKASFVGSAYEKYLEYYAGWINNDLVAKDALGLKYTDAIDAFTSGQSGMFIMGNWIVPSLEEAADFEIGVFAAPSVDGKAIPAATGPAQPYSIMKDTKNPELALSLVEFLVSDPTALATALAAEGNLRPGVSYERSALSDEVAAVLDNAPALVLGAAGPDLAAGFGDEINKQVQSLYIGSTPAQIAAALDAWWDANASA